MHVYIKMLYLCAYNFHENSFTVITLIYHRLIIIVKLINYFSLCLEHVISFLRMETTIILLILLAVS